MHDLINLADSYKFSHGTQYPPETVALHEYMEARKSPYDEIVWAGLTYYVTMLTQRVTTQQVAEAHTQAVKHGIPFDLAGWSYIATELNGRLPIHIRALPEGTIVKPGIPLLTVTSTDSNVPWVAGFIETLLMKVWYPTTVATKSRHVRKILEKFVTPKEANFMFHNFGDRASTSVESAFLGSLGHLTQFFGTDNFNSLHILQDFYSDEEIPAFSVFATEHSTTTAYGHCGEEEFVKTQIEDNKHRPILSFVADSYDVYEFTDMITNGELADLIKQPNMPMITIRPDSGNPLEVLPKMLDIMMHSDATTGTNNDGKMLFTNYRILWGDGITPETINDILNWAVSNYIAPQNFVFGSGGDIMQNVNRDTLGFAMKCSNITLSDGKEVPVYKDPITDPGKKSKKGKVTTYKVAGTNDFQAGVLGEAEIDALIDIYKDGEQIYFPNFNAVRERSGNSL